MSTRAHALWDKAFREVERHRIGCEMGLGHTMSGEVSAPAIARARVVLALSAKYASRSATRARVALCLAWIDEAAGLLAAAEAR